MEYFSAIKKEWENAICSNMDDPRNYYTKWNKSDTQRQKWYQLYVKSKKNYTNEFSYEIEETENKLKVTKDLKREGGID